MRTMNHVSIISTPSSWQQELSTAFTRLDTLLGYLELDIKDLSGYQSAQQSFSLLVTKSYASRIKKNDPLDPLLLQVLPTPSELELSPHYLKDPVGDDDATVLPGLIHKYHGRVLLIATPACAIHCRYCFRRSFPYSDNSSNPSQFDAVIKYLEQNTDISEVILSGGDPLTLSDNRLAKLIDQLSAIAHIKRLRIHTRIPSILPSRITTALTSILQSTSLRVVVVLHINHPNEISASVEQAIQKLKSAGISLLNQSVLLKSINDNASTLIELSERLFDNEVQPYYLHLLDKVEGGMHFDLSRTTALKIYTKLQQHLPGYLVPKLVVEEPGKASKTLII